MNNLKKMFLMAWLVGVVQVGNAMNYSDTDLLLVFRQDGFNDVEFDLGTVTNYVGLAQGTQKKIDFDLDLVKRNFNGNTTGVKFLLLSATTRNDINPRLWLTDVYLSSPPTDVTFSKYSQLRSKVSSIGQQGSAFTASNSSPAVVSASLPASFTYVASDGNLSPANALGGLTGFPVEAANPATLNFYELHISTTTPRPPAALMGTFTWDSAGVLTFSAGNAVIITAPTLTAITRSGNATTVSLTTVDGLKYQLQAASVVLGPFISVGNVVNGNGGTQSLSESSSDPSRFYRVQVSN